MTPIHTPEPRLSRIPSVYKHLHNESGLVRTGTLCHQKDGWLWHVQQEDGDHAGFAAVDDEAVAAEAPLGGRDGVAQR